MQPWRDFAKDLGLTIIAEIFSDYHGSQDVVGKTVNGVLYGSVHYLERGEPLSDRPMISALARHIVK